jgi:hypothetical protein
LLPPQEEMLEEENGVGLLFELIVGWLEKR